MRATVVALVLLGWATVPVAGQASVRTAVDTTVVTVGDRIRLTVSVDHPSSARVSLPDSLALAPFEVVDVRAEGEPASGGEGTSTWTITLAAFELGELEVPSFPVEVTAQSGTVDSLTTDAWGIQVVSVGADETGDLRDIRGPLGIPISGWIVALWVLVPLLVAAALYLLVRRLRPGEREAVRAALGPLPRPPHEVALEALAALEAASMLEEGRVKEYHIAASDILRTYVEDRFRVDALEMTTREVLEGLERAGADRGFRAGLRDFLDACDLVKFAKVRPDSGSSRATLALGRRIVLESVPAAPAPAEVPAAGPVGAASEGTS